VDGGVAQLVGPGQQPQEGLDWWSDWWGDWRGLCFSADSLEGAARVPARLAVFLGLHVERPMARLTLYLDAETKDRMRRAAKSAGLSQSRWLAELVRKGVAREWPAAVRELAGAWPDFPEAAELRRESGREIRRERL
jgi:hypothetical protein